MTSTPSTAPTEKYPTEWHMLDDTFGIETRQTSFDTFELRSGSHQITVNKEGFNLYRDRSEAGLVIFSDWCRRHRVTSVVRTDTDG